MMRYSFCLLQLNPPISQFHVARGWAILEWAIIEDLDMFTSARVPAIFSHHSSRDTASTAAADAAICPEPVYDMLRPADINFGGESISAHRSTRAVRRVLISGAGKS
jgi:hypothetical protein